MADLKDKKEMLLKELDELWGKFKKFVEEIPAPEPATWEEGDTNPHDRIEMGRSGMWKNHPEESGYVVKTKKSDEPVVPVDPDKPKD